MKRDKIYNEKLGVTIELSSFAPKGKVGEYHAIIHVEPRKQQFADQLLRLYEGEKMLLSMPELSGAKPVLKRFFLSDVANQRSLLREENGCAVSIIQQPPLDGSKVGLWIYLQNGTELTCDGGAIVTEHNGYRHIWETSMVETDGNSFRQTEVLLDRYNETLDRNNANLADNCVRTWFYVRDVDTQYKGMVNARKAHFADARLTEKTHYIASTGIGGVPVESDAIVQLDTYAITGMEPAQQQYLYAPTHLNPTYEYGVTFERGTVVKYGDRSHVLISGTASINNKGEVVYEGDIVNQTLRMWENVETLLAEAGAGFDDVMQIIVYLRDTGDYEVVSEMFKQRFPDKPVIITLAPVCRPTWLIEMECIAVTADGNDSFRDF